MARRPLGQYFLKDKQVTKTQLRLALKLQQCELDEGQAPKIGTVLVQMGAVDDAAVSSALEKQERDGVAETAAVLSHHSQ